MLKPSEIFQNEVLPAYSDFKTHPLDERLAKNAARAVDHHLDWVYEYYKINNQARLLGHKKLKPFRQEVFKSCGELKIMWDISDAAHHRFLTRDLHLRTVTTSTNSFTVKDEVLIVQGYKVRFIDALDVAVKFWQSWPD